MREKCLWIIGWVSLWWILNYLGIDWENLTIFAVVLCLDFIFWIADVYVTDKSEIKSWKARRWLFNKVTKLLLPMIVVIILKGVGFENMKFLVSAIMWILIVSEWYSIIGHIYSINTGKKLPEIDAFEMLVSKIAEVFKKIIKSFWDDLDPNNKND